MHDRHWIHACLGATIREVAGSEAPHLGRVYRREISEHGKVKRKSWNPIQKALGGPKQHEEFEPYDDDHPLVQLFRKPNSHYVAYDLWAYHMLFKGLTGEAHWWVMRNGFGVPVEIWVIPTHWMRLETGHYGEPVGYAVQSPWGHLQHVPYDEVVSFRDHSPLNMYEGTSILQACAEWIDSYESQVRARLAMFKNGGAPAFHILLGESYADPDEAFLARFYAKWMQRFQGENNWGKPVVTGPDVEVKTLGVTPDKIPFVDGEEMGRDEILAAFGVPKGVLGIEPTSDVSAYAPQRQFCRFRINPELKYIGEVITEKIVRTTPNHEDGVFFFDDHVINDPEQQRADVRLRWETASISPNQIAVLYGAEPWEHGGDDPVLNGAPVPWGTGKKDQDGSDLDTALRNQLGRQGSDKYALDQLESGEWTVNDPEGHVISGPFKTEELAWVGMSKLEAKDAKETERDELTGRQEQQQLGHTTDESVSDTALNGAQVTSLMEIVTNVVQGLMPDETAKPLIASAFPSIPADKLEEMLDGLRGFQPSQVVDGMKSAIGHVAHYAKRDYSRGYADDPPINKDSIDDDEPAPVANPVLRWHKTPNGDWESRGHRKWRIERVKDRKSGRIAYKLHLDGKPHDDSGAIGILKEVAERIEKDAEKKAMGEGSGASGGHLVPAEEVRLGANGAVAKALALRIKQLESAVSAPPSQTFNNTFHLPESIVASIKSPDVYIKNEIPVPQVMVKNDVQSPEVHVRNEVRSSDVVVHNNVEPTQVLVQNNVEAPQMPQINPIFQVPEGKAPKVNVDVHQPESPVTKGAKFRAKRNDDGSWDIEKKD